MKLQNFHIAIADWARPADRDALLHVRQEVFVDELGVPGLLEADEQDEDAFHVLARDDAGEAIGTARLTAQHRIGRLAVLPPWRGQGVGAAMLRQLLDRARKLGWPEVRLDAQVDAARFYQREGFVAEGELFEEQGLLHQTMHKALTAPLVQRPTSADPGVLPVDSRPSAEAARLQLLLDTRHTLAIHLPLLDIESYAREDELAQIRRIATSGRGASIRILLHDTAAALRDNHRLIALAQRLSSVIQIRRPVEEIDLANRAAWLLNDVGGYLFLPEYDRPQGRAARNDRASQAPLAQQFDEIWERSVRATELQALHL